MTETPRLPNVREVHPRNLTVNANVTLVEHDHKVTRGVITSTSSHVVMIRPQGSLVVKGVLKDNIKSAFVTKSNA